MKIIITPFQINLSHDIVHIKLFLFICDLFSGWVFYLEQSISISFVFFMMK